MVLRFFSASRSQADYIIGISRASSTTNRINEISANEGRRLVFGRDFCTNGLIVGDDYVIFISLGSIYLYNIIRKISSDNYNEIIVFFSLSLICMTIQISMKFNSK